MPPKHFRCLILLDWHKVIGRPQSDPVLQSFRNGAGSLQLGLWKPQAAAPADRWSETGATGQSYRERPFLRDPIANPMCFTLAGRDEEEEGGLLGGQLGELKDLSADDSG